MNMVKVKIKGTVITSQYGTLSNGDILNTSPEFAKHLVEECNAGKYLIAVEDSEKNLMPASQPASQPASKKANNKSAV